MTLGSEFQIPPGLPEEVAALIAKLVSRIEKLEAENADLKRRLGMNSSNSSKPPSSDAMAKPKQQERREGSAKKTGKRDRKGKNRNAFTDKPDDILSVRAAACPDCGTGLVGDGALYDRRQVAELVPKPFVVTEYDFYRMTCPCCGKSVDAPEPDGVLPGFTLGPRMVAFIGLLDHHGNVTYNKIETILREGFGLPICEGTIDNANRWLHAALAAPVAELKEVLPRLEHVHMDETGWKIEGKKHWLWTVATQD